MLELGCARTPDARAHSIPELYKKTDARARSIPELFDANPSLTMSKDGTDHYVNDQRVFDISTTMYEYWTNQNQCQFGHNL